MKFYLSSFGLGKHSAELKKLIENNKIGYIPNAGDFSTSDPVRREKWEKEDIQNLESLGLMVEVLDLKKYFGKTEALREKLSELGGIFVRGGNVFVLRQAMKLSGFDIIFWELERKDFLYSGYSAGICVLSHTLDGMHIVDDSTEDPYDLKETIREGLKFLNYTLLPHYNSNHPESYKINEELQYCKAHNIPYRTLRDGEVIIINKNGFSLNHSQNLPQ